MREKLEERWKDRIRSRWRLERASGGDMTTRKNWVQRKEENIERRQGNKR